MFRLICAQLLLLCLSCAALAGQIGPDDFQISQVTGIDTKYDATSAAIAYNPDDSEYLLVWRGDHDVIPNVADDHFEVWGQRLHPDLSHSGEEFRISTTGIDNVANYAVNEPELVYNSAAGEYFVVWAGALATGEQEIFGQRIDGGSGALVGANIRISNQGADGSLKYEAIEPDIAYSLAQNEYFVVWSGDATTIPIFDDDFEIFAQRLSSSGALVGAALQISNTGPAHDPDYPAYRPAVTYDRTRHHYMVVWQVDVIDAGVQWEIYGQRIDATTGADEGAEIWLSDGSTSAHDQHPDVTHSVINQQYLIVWSSDLNLGAGTEIYGQLFDVPTGQPIGANDFRISYMGPDGSSGYPAATPNVMWCATQERYQVTWSGVDDTAAGFEIYTQLLDSSTDPVGPAAVRLSEMGSDDGPFVARAPSVALGPASIAVVWHGDDDEGELVDEEFEIHGQLFDPATGAKINEGRLLTRVGYYRRQQVQAGDIAYNSVANEYLVTWRAETAHTSFEYGIFVRRVDAATGQVIDAQDLRVDEPRARNPYWPTAAYNPTTNEYLVSWGDTDSAVWARRLDATTLAEVGTNDIPISTRFPTALRREIDVAVQYCSGVDRFVLVWADERLASFEYELYMQQLDAAGNLQFASPLPVTNFGIPGESSFGVAQADMAYDSFNEQLSIVWVGSDGTGISRIFLQRFDLATNTNIGSLSQISDRILFPGSVDRDPSIAFNSHDREFLVTFWGDGGPGQSNIFMQRLDDSGAQIGVDDQMLSEGVSLTAKSDVAYSLAQNEYLVCWDQFLDQQWDISARLVGADGVPVGTSAFTMNITGQIGIHQPRVAHSSVSNNYLTSWIGPGNNEPFEMFGNEVHGQLYESDSATATAAPLPSDTVVGPRILLAYPNPFSTRLQFELELDRTRVLEVDVYDVRGRRVARLFSGRLDGPQVHSFSLSDRSLASGVYWIRVSGTQVERAHRVTLVR